jgi:hypothetical protein
MTGYLNKPGEGISVEQIQDTLKRFDTINGTDYSSQWEKARKEGKRDTLEAVRELNEAEKLTEGNKKGKSLIRRAIDMLEPEPVNMNQGNIDKVLKGNSSNPLNDRFLQDRKAQQTLDLVSDLTGYDRKELERFGRNIALDKSLDSGATNGSRNVWLGGGLGTLLGLGAGAIANSVGEKEYDYEPERWYDNIITRLGGLGTAVGGLLGGAKDKGVFNRFGKLAVKAVNEPTDFEKLKNFLLNSGRSGLIRTEGIRLQDKNRKKEADNELSKYADNVLNYYMNNRFVPTEAIRRVEDQNEQYFGRPY